ncbi:MAG TPA: carboxypeptidase regulatory-like domain-containing protein [Longimicrobiaceae bacterium]|nr:carboxypeptidase regulatory-like domain-containing protein [Longimicrobiaceae bacterium]
MKPLSAAPKYAVALLAAAPAAAQHIPPGGVVAGTIVDARSALPLAEATVSLEPRTGSTSAPAEAVGRVRATRTDAAGRYHFAGVAEGRYRLLVQRLGYGHAEVEVAMRGPAESRVSLGLEVERIRQRDYLAPDVRVVTSADVEAGVTLAETDLFRAIQRLPGVAAQDEYSAELWTRGAPWDHTRVYFDGLPLFNPVHTLGTFSGVNADAVGAVVLHPGVQPVSPGGGAAAALEIRSRRGGERGALAGAAEASLASVRAALDGATGDGRHAWMAAMRSSYSGWLMRQIERRTRDQDFWATSHFADATGRYDLRLGEWSALETSGTWQRDVVYDGPDSDWLGGTRPRWGNLALRATIRAQLGGLRTSLTAGASRFDAHVRELDDAPQRQGALFSWPTLFASASAVRHGVLEGSVGSAPCDQARCWSARAGSPGPAPPICWCSRPGCASATRRGRRRSSR